MELQEPRNDGTDSWCLCADVACDSHHGQTDSRDVHRL